jgi:hypothetical protein
MNQIPGSMLRMGNARKEIGFGAPPSFFDANTAVALAKILAAPTSRGIIVESANWDIDFPITDNNIASTFGKTLAPFSTPDGQPPPGVFMSSNTLTAPQMPTSDMVILGVRVRCLVEPESRLIRGNVFNPTGVTTVPGSPDVFSSADFGGAVLGFTGEGSPTAAGAGYIPAELLWGTPTWRAAYNLIKAYQLDWKMQHQDSLIKEPLTQIATVEPFAEAMAAGTSFTSNIDRIRVFNDRMNGVGGVSGIGPTPLIFEPITHKRLGSFNAGGGAGANAGDFTVTREEDGSPTVFGGIGVPGDDMLRSPLIFPVPVFWPSGQPFGLQLSLYNEDAQAEMQRWLSVTGGQNGIPGTDLALAPWSSPVGPVLVSPGFTGTGAGVMQEVTLDPVNGAGVPTAVSLGSPLMRFLGKGGVMVLEMGIIGMRITQSWKAAVYQAIQSGAIQAPMGFGTLPSA